MGTRGDFLNARFFVAFYALLAGTGFVIMGTAFKDNVLTTQGIALMTAIVSYYMGRRSHREPEQGA